MRLFAVSRDSPYSHAAWARRLRLNFPLLSDWEGEVVRGFGVAMECEGLSDIARRSAFLIDGSGVVVEAWSYGDDDLPDADELVSAAAALGV